MFIDLFKNLSMLNFLFLQSMLKVDHIFGDEGVLFLKKNYCKISF
jgi:hypothetical protein